MSNDVKGDAVGDARDCAPAESVAADAPDAAAAPEQVVEPSDGDDGENGAAAADEAEATPLISPLSSALDALQGRSKKLHDRLLRAAADLENYKKRARRELNESVQRAEEQIALAFLPILDNLERAIVHAEGGADEGSGGLMEGVRMVRKQFLGALARHDIEPFESIGTPFDPALQEAIQQQPSDEPRSTVLHELQKGYRRKGRLVRPAMVVVSSGPAEKPVAEESEEIVVEDDTEVEIVDGDPPAADGTEDTG